jgi:hypothetical protein
MIRVGRAPLSKGNPMRQSPTVREDPRKAYRVEETPPELAELLIAALDRILLDRSDANAR